MMRWKFCLSHLFAIGWLGLTVCILGTNVSAANRVALIVGNSQYDFLPELRTPAADSNAVARQFEKMGYDTVLLLDLTQKALLIALAELQLRAAQADQVVVYFAGHGVLQDGESYLIPVDGQISDQGSATGFIPLRLVIRAISDKPRQKIVFFDACRDSLEKAAIPNKSDKGRHRAEAGLFVFYSAQPRSPASDGNEKYSPFAKSVIEALNMPAMPIEKFAKRVRLDVIRATQGMQIPWSRSSLLQPAVLGLRSAFVD